MPAAHEVLREYRTKSKMSQQQAADAIDVSLSTVRRWEKGDYFPEGDNLTRFCAAYGISEETLLAQCGRDQPETPREAEAVPVRKARPWIAALVLMAGIVIGAFLHWYIADRSAPDDHIVPAGQTVPNYVITPEDQLESEDLPDGVYPTYPLLPLLPTEEGGR